MTMDFYKQINGNKNATYGLFVVFFIMIGILAAVISFIVSAYFSSSLFFFPILSIFGILSILFAIISYYSSNSIIIGISGAKEADPVKFKQLYNIIEELTIASGLPMPKVYTIDDTAINAFATGRDPKHSIVCVTTGCLTRLNRDEVQGVIAHELSHIRFYDIRTMAVASVLVGIAVLLSDLLLRMVFYSRGGNSDSKDSGYIFIILLVAGVILAILTPIIAQIINYSISRKREFAADAGSAELTRNPLALASALEKIKNDKEPLEAANKATAHLYIANPLKGQKLWMMSLFDTHPPIDARISALKGIKY